MKRFGLVIVTMFLAGSVHAQSLSDLLDEIRKLQASVEAVQTRNSVLEGRVSELQARLSGLTLSGGNYTLNAGSGSVTIRGSGVVFKSSGPLHMDGAAVTIDSSAPFLLRTQGSALFTIGGTMSLTAVTTQLKSSNAVRIEATGPATIESSSQLALRAANASIDAGQVLINGKPQ